MRVGTNNSEDCYPEIHCDECNEIIHTHFDCPICKTDDVGIGVYGDINDGDHKELIQCEQCNAILKIVHHDGYIGYGDKVLLQRISECS